MYCEGTGYFGPDRDAPYNWVYRKLGRDPGNFRDKVERLRREGIPLSPKLDWDVFLAARMLHDEIPLHSYPRRIMALMRQLRECEVRARESIKTFDQSDFGDSIEEKNRAADVLRSLFTANASQIGDLYFANIRDAFAIRHKESVTADEKCDLYCAAAALQTLVDIWDEAANLMKDLALVPREDTALGFEFLGIEELVTVVDVAAPRHRTILLTWSLPSPTAS